MDKITKKDLAELIVTSKMMNDTHDSANDFLFEVVSYGFSALASINPEGALVALDQLNEQKDKITSMIERRKKATDEAIEEIKKNLPDTLESV